jgi:clathrin heavy chain
VDENSIVPFILKSLNNAELAIRLASRNNLPGADDMYVTRFQQLFQSGNFQEAAKVAATSPRVSITKRNNLLKILGHFAYSADNRTF